MKTFKIFLLIIIAAVSGLITGCSEYITSSEENSIEASGNNVNIGNNIKNTRAAGFDVLSYCIVLRLKPHVSYTFNQSNTGLNVIYSIEAKRVNPEYKESCKDIFIHSSVDKEEIVYDCKTNNLNLNEITVQNTSNEIINVDVVLLGVKFVKNIKNEQ